MSERVTLNLQSKVGNNIKDKDEEFNYFRRFVKKIFDHKIWDDPDPSGEIAARLAKDDATTAKSLFDEKELTVQWVLGA